MPIKGEGGGQLFSKICHYLILIADKEVQNTDNQKNLAASLLIIKIDKKQDV